jgi:uncharacterized protein (TIGR03084 family)
VDAIVDALSEQAAELGALLADRGDEEAARPSACAGWSVADVVLHLAQTNELALASVRGTFPELAAEFAAGGHPAGADPVDAAADLSVERERDQPWPAIHARWCTSAATLEDAFRAADPHARVVWVAGQLSVRTLATTRLAETWIHTGDVACGLGVDVAPTDRLRHVSRLAWRTLPYAFARAGREPPGPVAFALTGPGGDVWDFATDDRAPTTIRGPAVELCLVAARRVAPADTGLVGEGPDAEAVLELVRTYA